MEPSYRIDLEHDPTELTLPWRAKIIRCADDTHVKSVFGTTRTDAFEAAQAWVRAKAETPERTTSLYVDEDGEIHLATPAAVADQIVDGRQT